ncbi:MAG: molybdenum cofactor guanylyltransferase [bacterium]|nr:molybdenum cofactor guanylyltransferase [bacterium]
MGQDKAHLPFGEVTLLEHVVSVVSPCVDQVWLVAREGQELVANEQLGLPVARDPEDGLGPLAGLLAGLRSARAEHAFTVSCDVPLLERALVRGLLDLASETRGVIPRVGGHYMTTCAVYARSLVPEIEALLEAGERRARVLVETPGVRVVDEDDLRRFDPELRSFVDCNTPDRYREALLLSGIEPEA